MIDDHGHQLEDRGAAYRPILELNLNYHCYNDSTASFGN